MSDDLSELLGRRVADLRHARGLSQERLAELVGVDVTYISRLERASGLNATLAKLVGIAEALGVPVHSLLLDPADGGDTSIPAALVRAVQPLSKHDLGLVVHVAEHLADGARSTSKAAPRKKPKTAEPKG